MKSITRAAAVVAGSVLLALPLLASAATSLYVDSSGNFAFSYGAGANCGANNICQVASTILYIINFVLVPVLFALAFIVFLYGVAVKYIFSHGDQTKVSEGHKLILWGIIGFVIMVSLWGLVNVVANTFGLAGYYAPPTPTSY